MERKTKTMVTLLNKFGQEFTDELISSSVIWGTQTWTVKNSYGELVTVTEREGWTEVENWRVAK